MKLTIRRSGLCCVDVNALSSPLVSFNVWVNECPNGVCTLTQIGEGTVSSQPLNVRYWQGGSNVAQTYYVEVINNATAAINYAIAFTDGTYPPPGLTIVPVPAPSLPVAPTPTPSPPPTPSTPSGGTSVSTASPLNSLASGILQAGQSVWYTFFTDGNGQQGLALNFTPASLEDPVTTNVVGFNVLQNACSTTGVCGLTTVGAGTISGLPFGFKYWTTSASDQTFYIQVFNS